jgi:non-heme Fe2+,alpha-ketoglutarate-dependent halogenase
VVERYFNKGDPMPKILTEEQVRRYREDGFASPVRVMSADDARRLRTALEATEAAQGHAMRFPEKSKSHLLYRWSDAIVHHPAVLDAIEDLIGPDILCFHTTLWIKEARQPAFVLWHQDGRYFDLDPAVQITAWIALSDASVEAGAVEVLPGSHTLGPLDHIDDPSEMNLIRRGQGIRGRFDDANGAMMAHDTMVVHRSGPNDTDDRRIGLGISFIPTSVRQTGTGKLTALLARGTDRFRHFVPEARLVQEGSPESRAAHEAAVASFKQSQDAGAGKVTA